jgi:hypothetical protein
MQEKTRRQIRGGEDTRLLHRTILQSAIELEVGRDIKLR